jgi:ribosome-binding factor A
MNEILTTTLNVVAIPILGALTAFACAWINQKTKIMQEHIKDDRLKRYLALADDAITSAVSSVSQTYVDALKKENAFTAEAQKEAFAKAKNLTLQILGNKTKEAITAEMANADFAAWLNAKIEQAVRTTQ